MRLILFFICLPFLANAQSLSYQSIYDLCDSRNERYIKQFLVNKGYDIDYEASPSQNFDSTLSCIYVSDNFPWDSKIVEAHKMKGKIKMITYYVFDYSEFKSLISEIQANNYKFKRTTPEGNTIYRREDATISTSLFTAKIDNKEYKKYSISIMLDKYLLDDSLNVITKEEHPIEVPPKTIDKYRAFDFSYTNDILSKTGKKETRWNPVDLLVVINYEKKKINIYSKEPQEYDLIMTTATNSYSDERDANESTIYCIDQKGKGCNVSLIKYVHPEGEHTLTLIFTYDDVSYAYRLKDN